MRRTRLLSTIARERYTSLTSITKALDVITTRLVEISERDGRQFLEDLINELQQILADYDKSPVRRRHINAIRGGRASPGPQEHAVPNDKKG